MAGRRSGSTVPWSGTDSLGLLVADEDPLAWAGLRVEVAPGVTAAFCGGGAEALWYAGSGQPVVTVVSATLTGVSAVDVVTVLMSHGEHLPVVVVGVGPGEADLAGPVLAAGASSVVSRPYLQREIDSLLRRHLPLRGAWLGPSRTLTVGDLELDGPAFVARAGGRRMHLTLRQFEILHELMLSAGEVVSAEHLRQRVWADHAGAVSPNTIAVHMRHLRRHLAGAAVIAAVRGVGYRLIVGDGHVSADAAYSGCDG